MPKVVSHKAALYNGVFVFARLFLHIIYNASPHVAAKMHKMAAESFRRLSLIPLCARDPLR